MNNRDILSFFPSDWKWKKVKYCFGISKQEAHIEDPVILSLARSGIKIRDISNNEGQIAESYDKYNLVIPGDLLLNPMDLYSGDNCNVSEVKGVISPAYINLRAKNGFLAKYYNFVFKYLYWSKFLQAYGTGVSFEHRWTLSPNTLLNLYLPVPSFNEQEKIASFLCEKTKSLDELIEIKKEEIKLLKLRFISIINQEINSVSNFTATPLKYLATCNDESLSNNTEKDFEFDYIDISSVSLEEGIICTESMNFENAPSRARRIVQKNDIIVSTVRTYLKAIAIIDDVHSDCIVSTGFAVIRPKEGINHEYLGYFMRSDAFTNEVSKASFGVSYPAIQSERLMNLRIRIPSEKDQLVVINNIKNKQKLITELIEEKANLLNEYISLKKNLIFDYAFGKRRL